MERWFGIVENRLDPLYLGRCQVRIFSLHSYDNEKEPTSELPWAMVEMPPTVAGVSGIGTSHELVEGSFVSGYFVDDDRAQQPVICGVLAANPVWSDKDREKTIDTSIFRDLPNMFKGDEEKAFEELSEGTILSRDLQIRFMFEGPHINIKPDLDYESRVGVSMPAVGGQSSQRMEVFRHLFAIFSSNINYLCVSKENRMGKYQFTPKFLKSKGYLSGDDILDDEQWSEKDDIESLTEFLQAYTVQEELFVDQVLDVANSIVSDNDADFFGKLMVGLLMYNGMDDWSDKEAKYDKEGRSSVDAYMKGLLVHYHTEQL